MSSTPGIEFFTHHSSFKLLQRYNIRGPKTILLKGIEKR